MSTLFPQPIEQVIIPEHIQVLNIMRRQNARSLDTRKQIFKMNFQNFWRTRELAQAICDEEGTEAHKWFTESWKEQLAIKELDPTWIFLTPPFPVEINEDGTVTILEQNPE